MTAVIRHTASACLDAPATEVWERLARLEDIQLWSESVVSARCDSERARGVGAERVCRLAGGITIRERWLEWEEGRGFLYEGVGIPFADRARNRWTVHPYGHQTVLVSQAEVWLKGGLLGRLVAPLISRQIDRVAGRTLAAFKYLVEHGEPPRAKHARLPLPAPAC
jgi:polyketide cyclase/dehydrase/lipid transport protein